MLRRTLERLFFAPLLMLAASDLSAQGWKVGDRLPELRLPTIDGRNSIDLSTLLGQKLLLIEFASW